MLVEPGNSQHDNAGIVGWRIRSDVGEVQVQRDDYANFLLTNMGQLRIGLSDQVLVHYRRRIVTRTTQYFGYFNRQVFVNLELEHQATLLGRYTVRSRANSAAYSSAA